MTRLPEDLRLDFAFDDTDLVWRLENNEWFNSRPYMIPWWLKVNCPITGSPNLVSERRLDELRENGCDPSESLPHNDNELRYTRNKAAIQEIYQQFEPPQNWLSRSYCRSRPPQAPSVWPPTAAWGYPPSLTSQVTPIGSQQQPRSTLKPFNTSAGQITYHNPYEQVHTYPATIPTCETRTTKPAEITRPHANAFPAVKSGSFDVQAIRKHLVGFAASLAAAPICESRAPKPAGAVKSGGFDVAELGQRFVELAKKCGVLKPFVDSEVKKATPSSVLQPRLNPEAQDFVPTALAKREDLPDATDGFPQLIKEGRALLDRLEGEKDALLRSLRGEISLKQDAHDVIRELKAAHARALARMTIMLEVVESLEAENAIRTHSSNSTKSSNIEQGVVLPVPASLRGTKRNADTMSIASPVQVINEVDTYDKYDTNDHLYQLAVEISDDLDKAVVNETIHLCGLTHLHVIKTRPDDVMEVAREKLHTIKYECVEVQWRRLFEDASLHKAVQMLQTQASSTELSPAARGKRQRGNDDTIVVRDDISDGFSELISMLDYAVLMTGAPGRKELFDGVFQQLDNILPQADYEGIPDEFDIARPESLVSQHHIARSEEPHGVEEFCSWMHDTREPIIIPGMLEYWNASTRWSNPSYLLDRTLGGRRLVPVEVGRSYTDESWSQRMMSMRDFLTRYLLPANPAEVGYLAQYDLFAQIPALREDFKIPDICNTNPPPADEATLRTAGLASVKQLDEPVFNAWFGPKGTKTPLHTDPYHNTLCQVVGYKYVRLYAPDQAVKLYPRGVDDKGISMENTSQVDVSHVRTRSLGGSMNPDIIGMIREKYPEFEEAEYVEGILGPGESLYVPLGWWHYVESLTTSFSVSFWWN